MYDMIHRTYRYCKYNLVIAEETIGHAFWSTSALLLKDRSHDMKYASEISIIDIQRVYGRILRGVEWRCGRQQVSSGGIGGVRWRREKRMRVDSEPLSYPFV
jgi:hypothetical protein